MRLCKSKTPSSLSFNMTPMIDIVFLLIIFFMTVSQITRTVDLPLPLPRVTLGDEDATPSSVTVNLDREGNIIIGDKMLSMNKALAAIQKKLEQTDNDPRRVRIQIRCYRNCECKHVTELFKNLANLGFTNVRSAVSDM